MLKTGIYLQKSNKYVKKVSISDLTWHVDGSTDSFSDYPMISFIDPMLMNLSFRV